MRSLFACILKAFGVILVYSSWLSALHVFFLSTSQIPLIETLGQEVTLPQRLVVFAAPIASFLFGCVLLFLSHPLSCLMFRQEESAQPGPVVTGDLMLVGLCLASFWFLVGILPDVAEELAHAAKANELHLASPRFAARALQLLIIVVVLILRRPISKWCSGGLREAT